ncbi:MAG: ABC transporter ATP-binding protein [Candidatus Hydrogenedentales bacterium]|jgi:multiple sugar transport system ATP-binding protein
MARVVLNNVSKVFPGNIHALKNINLSIEDGEFVVLVGPSGCGKSTALRIIAGLDACTGGEILIDDKAVNEVPPKNRDIAMVFQNYALYPHMTVYKNMAFGLMLRKYARQEIEQRVHSVAERLGITELLQRKPRELSGGQRQRVAVGRAIVRQPKVFLFDEPLSNLDAKLRVQMRSEITGLHASLKSTMIYVTHDQVEAMTMGDRIVVMRDGEIQQIAAPLELYQAPANVFVGTFIGTPQMNIVEGSVEGNETGLYFCASGTTTRLKIPESKKAALEAYGTQKILLGIRPEQLQCVSLPHDGQQICGTVEMIELTGAEAHLYLKVNDAVLAARVNPTISVNRGDKQCLLVDMEACSYFDSTTTCAIA